MKTTEKVNIAGYSFTLEEDAYLELEKYLADTRESFREDSNAEEIILDIEERIAELLNEKYSSGVPVGIPAVKEICGRIGRPEELADDVPSVQNLRKNKRMYRDTENRVLGGVCSGLGTYFNSDKVFFRLAFLSAFLLPAVFVSEEPLCLLAVAVYACLWIAMPAARTVEEKCRMKGKPLRLGNFRRTAAAASVYREAKEIKESPALKAAGRIAMTLSGIIMTTIGFAGLLSLIFAHKAPELAKLHMDRYIMEWGSADAAETFVMQIAASSAFWQFIIVCIGIFCIWMLYNGIRFIFAMKSPSWKPGIILFVLWLISILALVAWILIQVSEALPAIIA